MALPHPRPRPSYFASGTEDVELSGAREQGYQLSIIFTTDCLCHTGRAFNTPTHIRIRHSFCQGKRKVTSTCTKCIGS